MDLEVNKMQEFELQMLKDLYSAEKGIKPYDFHKKYLLSPAFIFSFKEKFQQLGFINEPSGDLLILTKLGINWVNNHKNYLYLKPANKAWKIPPENMMTTPIEGCYLPDESKIDKNYFNKIINENNGT